MSQLSRIRSAFKVLKEFGKTPQGELIDGRLTKDMAEQNMCDIVTNFAHYCDVRGFNFGGILRTSQAHYQAETQGQGAQEFSTNDLPRRW